MSDVSKLAAPPGPKGHWLLGSLGEFKKDMAGFMRECVRNHGPISSFKVGPWRGVLVVEPELIKTLLQDRGEWTRKSFDERQLRSLVGDGLLLSEGETWRKARKAVMPSFNHQRLRQYAEVMAHQTDAMLDQWQGQPQRELHRDMMKLTLVIVADCLFGADLADDAKVVGDAMDAFMERYERVVSGQALFPFPTPTPGNLRAMNATRRIRRLVKHLVQARQTGEHAGADLMSWLVENQAAFGMSDGQLRDEILTMVLAGHETTALTLTWAFTLIAERPELEARLLAEIRMVTGGGEIRPDDWERFTLCKQVIKETLRYYPPAWVLGREATRDTALGGYRIRKGDQLVVPLYLLHHDRRHYDAPGEFFPERWTPEFEVELHKYAYLPFGGGPRLCAGAAFAMMEATLLLAKIVQRYQVRLDPDHPIEPHLTVTNRPRYGVKAVASPRDGATPALRAVNG